MFKNKVSTIQGFFLFYILPKIVLQIIFLRRVSEMQIKYYGF